MGHYIDVDLDDALDTKNLEALQHIVNKLKSEILENWFFKEHETMEKSLRIVTQRAARAQRKMKKEMTEWEIPYLLGRYETYGEIFYTLYRKEEEDRDLIQRTAEHSAVTTKILQALMNERNGLRHGVLAETLKMSDSGLTNNMKRIAKIGAVEISRSGKNTFYSLTDAGRRYCKDEQKRQIRSENEQRRSAETAYNIISKMAAEMIKPRVRVGDVIKITEPLFVGEHILTDCTYDEKIISAHFMQINRTQAPEKTMVSERILEKIREYVSNSYSEDNCLEHQPVSAQA